jgi:hypothetical protein
MSEGRIYISAAKERLGHMKAEADPAFDLEAFLAEGEKAGKEGFEAKTELANTLRTKFGFDETTARDLIHSLHLMEARELHLRELGKLGREAVVTASAMRRLSSDLLNDNPLAVALLEQWREALREQENFTELTWRETLRLAKEAGIDTDEMQMHSPFPDGLGKFYWALQETEVFKDALAKYFRQNERAGDAFHKWLTQDEPKAHNENTQSIGTAQLATIARTSAFAQVLCFTGDNIHRAAITAWARAAEWQAGDKYFRGLEQEYSNLKITVSLPNGDQAASLWEFLQKGGAAMVKAHYALWARYYEQVPDGLSLEYVVVNVSDFCRDLGYAKATNGGYKPEARRRAMQLLEALTSTQMAATYQTPSKKKGLNKQKRIKGTIWQRGLEAEERDTYEDLFGQAREGDREQWVPVSFSFAPGPWHADKDWRRYNRFVGKIGAGLMQLDNRYDEWAILIGGYLGTLARTGKYRARRLKISTILENTGLGKAIGHRQAQYREKFYKALDRLQEEGIIAGYKTDGFDDSDVDPDDLAALAEYGGKDPYPPGDWRGYIVEFQFDFAADMQRLEAREKTAIAAKSKKRPKPKVPTPAV